MCRVWGCPGKGSTRFFMQRLLPFRCRTIHSRNRVVKLGKPNCHLRSSRFIYTPVSQSDTYFRANLNLITKCYSPAPSPPLHLSLAVPTILLPIALLSIQSLLLATSSCPFPSPNSGITSPPSSLLNKTSSSGRKKYTTLYLATLACFPGGGTTRWMLDRSRPLENLDMASPRLTIAWPGRGRT